MRRVVVAACLLIVAACRTTRPAGEETPFAPIAAASSDEALRQLQNVAMSMPGARSLMRIRATNGDRTQSFRAQLQVSAGAMLLTAYTPIGTTAMRLFASGGQVTFINDVDSTWWKGSAPDFARAFGFFGDAPPASMALLMFGLPAAGASVDATPNGLARAAIGDATLTYEPPSFPPKNVSVVRGAQRLDIEHLETAQSNARIDEPRPPADYRCCVPPRL
jgi:hypothetical protein